MTKRADDRSKSMPLRLIWWPVAISRVGDGVFVTAFPLLAASLTREPGVIAGVTVVDEAGLFVAMDDPEGNEFCVGVGAP